MDGWIEWGRGPLFRLALASCLLGLAYRLAVCIWQIESSRRKAGDPRLPGRVIFKATLRWLLPVRLFKVRPVFGIASFLFHMGIVLVPLFYAGHVALWKRAFSIPWTTLPPVASDCLTLLAIAGLITILLGRLVVQASRDLTSWVDIWILLLLLGLLGSGYWSSHPASSPTAPRWMLLTHIMMGNLVLVLAPLSKIIHCVLAPLTQLLSEVGWHFPAESGRQVAIALAKENEPL